MIFCDNNFESELKFNDNYNMMVEQVFLREQPPETSKACQSSRLF